MDSFQIMNIDESARKKMARMRCGARCVPIHGFQTLLIFERITHEVKFGV